MTGSGEFVPQNKSSETSEFPVAYVLVPLWIGVNLLFVVGMSIASGTEGNMLFAAGLAVLAVLGIVGIYCTVKFVQEGVLVLLIYLGISFMIRLAQSDLLLIVDVLAIFFLLRYIGNARYLNIKSYMN